MAALWDEGLKRILAESPQDFITWLIRDAVYLNQVSSELSLEVDRHRKVIADAVCTCTLHEQPIAVHVEFQSESDRDMALRLLAYKEIWQEGEEKGLKEGLKKGRREGLKKGRQALLGKNEGGQH